MAYRRCNRKRKQEPESFHWALAARHLPVTRRWSPGAGARPQRPPGHGLVSPSPSPSPRRRPQWPHKRPSPARPTAAHLRPRPATKGTAAWQAPPDWRLGAYSGEQPGLDLPARGAHSGPSTAAHPHLLRPGDDEDGRWRRGSQRPTRLPASAWSSCSHGPARSEDGAGSPFS